MHEMHLKSQENYYTKFSDSCKYAWGQNAIKTILTWTIIQPWNKICHSWISKNYHNTNIKSLLVFWLFYMHDATNHFLLIYLLGIIPKYSNKGKHTNSKVSA